VNADAFPLAARRAGTTVIEIGGVEIGGPEIVLVAGPCSVESEEQLRAAALAARAAGASVLRGGAFKPRTSPYAFQGLGEEGLALLRAIGDETGLPVVTEALEPGHVPVVAAHADAIQIGSRNMHVTPLLRAAAASGRPILLKRGMSATLEEFLLAAETILLAGNERVVLCERGIRTFDSYTRNCLDVGGIAALKHLTHLPVVADPSHATGRRELVTDAALAAVAAGADGLIVEAHPEPESARSDADQQLTPSELADLGERVSRVALALGRTLPRSLPNELRRRASS
jgi:3-deoxy-7-phosphoheptulonate synthase